MASSTDEPNEDDILLNCEENFVDEEIDEEALLGPCSSKSSGSPDELLQVSNDNNVIDSCTNGGTNANDVLEDDVLDFDESISERDEDESSSQINENGKSDDDSNVKDMSLDDDDEEDAKPRDKFETERKPNVSSGAAGKPIPDSLDQVKVNHTSSDSQRGKQRGGRRRFHHQTRPNKANKVLINPFYRGSVPVDPNFRLRLVPDPHPQPLFQIGAVKVKPPRPVVPLLHQPMSLFNFNVPTYPIVSLPPPVASLPLPFPPPVNYPPPLVIPPSMGRYTHPASTVMTSCAPTIITSCSVGPRLPVPLIAKDDIWEKKTEDFLRKASGSDRQSAADNIKRYGLPSPMSVPSYSSKPHGFSSFGVSRENKSQGNVKRRTPERQKAVKQKEQQEKMQTMELVQKLGLDDDYVRKVEDQKRLREQLNNRKEIRRQQEMKKKQGDLKEKDKDSTIKREHENDEKSDIPIKPKIIRLKKSPENTKEIKVNEETVTPPSPRKVIIPVTRDGATTEVLKRTVVNPNAPTNQSVTKTKIVVETIPIIRTIQCEPKSPKTKDSEDTDAKLKKKHISINERFSKQRPAETILATVPPVPTQSVEHESSPVIAAVVSNFGPILGTERMRIIAGTIGSVQACLQPAADKMIVLFEQPTNAAKFCQHYNGRILNGSAISVTLQPYTS